jgi:F-type H+-transporting ATPase subunit alpha
VLSATGRKIVEGGHVKRPEACSDPGRRDAARRIVSPLGQPLDGKGEHRDDRRPSGPVKAPGVVQRQGRSSSRSRTGLRPIDAMIPIGAASASSIIGDARPGKTGDRGSTAIINNKDTGSSRCTWRSASARSTSVPLASPRRWRASAATIIGRRARRRGRADQVHGARTPGCAMAEYFLYTGSTRSCVYDDLTKHAYAYRQMSLLLRRPPGREAYPGDVFYLHSRLLERAVKLNDDLGGGSLTALPIIETQAGDVSAYIPTNVISITDGQIFLEPTCSTRACARPSTWASRCRAWAATRRSSR